MYVVLRSLAQLEELEEEERMTVKLITKASGEKSVNLRHTGRSGGVPSTARVEI